MPARLKLTSTQINKRFIDAKKLNLLVYTTITISKFVQTLIIT